MVVIRLARGGSKKRPFYYVVATDKRNKRDGRYIERLGFFNPIAKGKEVRLNLEREKIYAWVAKGAQLSDRLNSLIAEWDKKAA
jgi:small subunit ribosomal protein S16